MKQRHALTDSICQNATCPPDRPRGVSLWDGEGLYLKVWPAGTKTWKLNYSRHGRLRTVTLGEFTRGIDVAKARQMAERIYVDLCENADYDPAAERRAKKTAEVADSKRNVLFEEQAEFYMNEQVRLQRWTPMPDHLRRLWRADKPLPRGERHGTSTEHRNRDRIKRHIYPALRGKKMGNLTAAHYAQVINSVGSPNERKKVADLLRGIVKTWLPHVPGTPDPMDSAMQRQLSVHPEYVSGHFPAITEPKTFGFMVRDVRRQLGANAVNHSLYLFLIQAYLWQRPGALAQMRWSEIDWEQSVWKCPKWIMKRSQKQKKYTQENNRYFAVPLPTQVVELLKKLLPFAQNEYVFEGRGGRGHVSPASAKKLIARAGYDGQQTLHGFRSSAKTILKNHFALDQNLVEKQLDHLIDPVLGEAYDRAEMVFLRADLLQCWADLVGWLENGNSIWEFVPPNDAIRQVRKSRANSNTCEQIC